jgi:hypothetical protein
MGKARFTPWVALTLALTLSSCSGVLLEKRLLEKRLNDGKTKWVRLKAGDKWSISPSRDPTQKEETIIFVEKEWPF